MSGSRIMDGHWWWFSWYHYGDSTSQAHFTLIDSIGKKINVVQDLVDKLELKNVEARQCRAEEVKKSLTLLPGVQLKTYLKMKDQG